MDDLVDNALTCIGRYVLLDAMMLCAIASTIYTWSVFRNFNLEGR